MGPGGRHRDRWDGLYFVAYFYLFIKRYNATLRKEPGVVSLFKQQQLLLLNSFGFLSSY